MSIECLKFTPFSKGVVLGFFDIYVEKWGIEIHGCSICEKNGGKWINFPSKEFEDEKGEKKWKQLMRFRDVEHKGKFNSLVVKEVERFFSQNNIKMPTK